MRSLMSLLILASGGTASGASPNQSDTLRISALDCEFQFPPTYTVKVGNEPGAFLYNSAASELRNITFAPLDVSLVAGAPPPAKSEQRGPLKVDHYAIPISGRASPEKFFMSVIRGQSQQLKIVGLPPEQVETYVAQCLDTMDPAIVAASKRRANGCTSELPLETAMKAVLGQTKPQIVFSDGKLIGWRVYGIEAGSALSNAGVTQGSLLSQICGIPADELLANPDNVCCATDTSQEISATFRSNGGPPRSIAIKRGT